MPVQDARVIDMPVRGDVRGEVRRDVRGDLRSDAQLEGHDAPRPAAVDAVRWGATLLSQLGFDPQARSVNRTAA
jgi:hypothetical protein